MHQDTDEKSCFRAELLSALRFWDSRNEIDSSPLPYILIWIKLLGGWPSIVNGGCQFVLQVRFKFIDQVRILAKFRIHWNHGRILLCPGLGDILDSTFGVNMDLFQESLWNEPCSNFRGLEHPGPIQPGMLDFCPRTVQTLTIGKSCSVLGQSQCFAIWGMVNPEKIAEFLNRMKVDMYF